MFDYISILAGGVCSFNCDYCVGQNVREQKKPHFADSWEEFIDYFKIVTRWISISGSTSDPSLVDKDLLKEMIVYSINSGLNVSLHTRSTKPFIGELGGLCNELVLSVDEPNKENTEFVNNLHYDGVDVRISSVCTSKNKSMFESKEFYKAYKAIRFTVRMNVFEPDLEKPKIPYPRINKEKYDAEWYGDIKKKIALWDFTKTNKKIKALYLWPTGEVKEQCHWMSLY